MDTDCDFSQKRKNTSDSEDVIASKRIKLESNLNILNLPDEVLIKILKNVDATSLYQLGRTCTRFQRLVVDPYLWKFVDARRFPNTTHKIQFVTGNIGASTETLLLSADNRSDHIISLSFITMYLSSPYMQNVSVLALENQFLDGKLVKIKEFPKTLQELSFRRSFVSDYRKFFSMSSEAMSNLRVLILDQCQWVETDMVLSISKYPSLEILSLYMCKKVGDRDFVYLSICGRLGFKNIKVLDARFTGLGSECINAFHRSKTIREIYFQSYCATYREERQFRKEQIKTSGKPTDEVGYLSDDEDNNDTCLDSFKRRFGGNSLSTYKMDTLNDMSMYFLQKNESLKDDKGRRPSSVLYKYPYSECTCGFHERFWNTNSALEPYSLNTSKSCNQIRNDIPHQDSIYLLQIDPIAHNRFRKYSEEMLELPAYLQVAATPETKDRRWMGLRDPKNDYEIAMIEHTDYQIDSYAIAPHFLDVTSIDFSSPMAVMSTLNQEMARRRTHIIRTGATLDTEHLCQRLLFDLNPTDEILSFTTELLVYVAQLLYLVCDEYALNKMVLVVNTAIQMTYQNVYSSSLHMLQRDIMEISKNVSCETRKVLRAFLIGMATLQNIDHQFRYSICKLIQQVKRKVGGECVAPCVVLRTKCDEFRSHIPHDLGVYVNEVPESYSDEFWGFKVIENKICYYQKERKCPCDDQDCQLKDHFDEVVIWDGCSEVLTKELPVRPTSSQKKSPCTIFSCQDSPLNLSQPKLSGLHLRPSCSGSQRRPSCSGSQRRPSCPGSQSERQEIRHSSALRLQRALNHIDQNMAAAGSLVNNEINRMFREIDMPAENVNIAEPAMVRLSRRAQNDRDASVNNEDEDPPSPEDEGEPSRRAEPGTSSRPATPPHNLGVRIVHGAVRPERPRSPVGIRFHLHLDDEIDVIDYMRGRQRYETPLKRLSLRGFPNITDRALKFIEHLELELLDVAKTAVTPAAVRNYMVLHPNCRVVHESACVCGPRLHF